MPHSANDDRLHRILISQLCVLLLPDWLYKTVNNNCLYCSINVNLSTEILKYRSELIYHDSILLLFINKLGYTLVFYCRTLL